MYPIKSPEQLSTIMDSELDVYIDTKNGLRKVHYEAIVGNIGYITVYFNQRVKDATPLFYQILPETTLVYDEI